MKTDWKRARVLGVRLLLLALGSMLGMSLGVMAECVAAEPLYLPPRSREDWVGNVLVALVLSPLTVTAGGPGAISGLPSPYNLLLLPGGVLFWPVYALLAWRWMKTESPWPLILIVLWCVQGFLLLLHRLELIMSV